MFIFNWGTGTGYMKGRLFMNKNIKFLTTAGVIAALYAALTILIPGGSGVIQVRVSEIMTVLPFFTPAAIPGLFVGCLISNFVVGAGIVDLIFGSMATLIAAYLTYKMPKKYFAPLPPVVVNALIVGAELAFIYKVPLFSTIFFVGVGELIACYALGYPFLLALEKYKVKLFKQ